ncbi:hypothetical protein ACI7RC_10780 [Brevibacillus sp. B_LB10_24]|uniref:hypothetical protein n=1 Tax=Brevibacillus sp. B_LB10_24 TaxID=3380645 RepID=UPI0038BAF4E5
MKSPKVGDVFEIATTKGKAFFQYVLNKPDTGQLIRILPGLYNDTNNLEELVKGNELFFVYFPLKAAYKQGILKHLGNYDVPKSFKPPRYMRSKSVDKDGNLIKWHIVDTETWHREPVSELSNDQKKLSPWGIWNDSLLIERLSNGWNLDKWV